MKDYTPNSDKSKAADNPEPKPKQEKAVKGEVVIVKPSLGARFKNVFFGGDANTTAQYVLSEVILPAARTLVVDTVTKAVERVIYGDNSYRPRRPSSSYAPRINYNRMSDREDYRPRGFVPGQAPRGNKIFEDVIVGTKEDAEILIERVGDVVDKYSVVTIADVLDILGLDSVHVDNKWGWEYLPTIQVNQVREGWRVTFPTPEEI